MSTPMETSEELLQPIESNEATENAQNDADILLEDLNDTQDPMEETKQMEESQKTLEALDQIPDIIEKLGQDNTQYELHIQLIDLLKQADLPEQLEDARWTMHDVYPLSESLWLDWINDTKKEATTEEGEQKLRRLYEEAERDYFSIDIWKSYTEFIMEKFYKSFEAMDEEDEELIEATREDLLKAVSATAFHVKRSQEIWRLYAQFETDVMNKFKKPEQIARVKKIYLDRLDVLHIDCEETFNAYSTYITAWDNANYESNMVEANKIYAATKVAADERDVFEQKLVTDGYALDTFYEYIENEKAAKNKFSLNNIRCLYERAILIYCTDPGLWNDYIMFLIEKARVQSFLEHICRRSVRNCPWSGALWAHLARLIETRGGEPKEINEIFDKALSFQPLLASIEDLVAVLLAKCDYYRRRIDWDDLDDNAVMDLRVAFEESLAYVDEAFPKSGDPYYRIEKFYAHISTRLGDADKARELWESVVVKRGRDTEAWIQYINFERNLGNYHKCESLFKKAIVKRIDNPTRLIDVWNDMEHEFGTLTTHEDALVRIHQKTKALASEWQAQYAGQEQRKQTKEMKEQEHKRKKGLHRIHQKQKQKEKQASFKKVEGQKELLGIEEDNDQVQTEASSSLKRKASTEDIDQEAVKRTKTQPQGSSRGRAPRPARRGKSIALGPSRMSRDHKPAQETETPATVTAEPKSNDDFRAMLLGKK